jgi:LysM repeat protein
VPRLRLVANRVAVGTCAALAAACGGGGHGHLVTAASVAPTTTMVVTTTTIPPVTYTVKRGDTLSSIAKQFGGTVEALIAANHIAEANVITQGQVLVIPPPPTPPSTTVAPGTSTSVAAVTTTTAAPVAAGPAAFVITPAHAQVGNIFNFKVTGTKPAEAVTFEIDSPDGRKSTGQPHTASSKGTVLASYLTTQANGPVLYTVIATGSLGTSVRSTFRVDP